MNSSTVVVLVLSSIICGAAIGENGIIIDWPTITGVCSIILDPDIIGELRYICELLLIMASAPYIANKESRIT